MSAGDAVTARFADGSAKLQVSSVHPDGNAV
jgi:hypothetical protein